MTNVFVVIYLSRPVYTILTWMYPTIIGFKIREINNQLIKQ